MTATKAFRKSLGVILFIEDLADLGFAGSAGREFQSRPTRN
jgi:hypothetical protein